VNIRYGVTRQLVGKPIDASATAAVVSMMIAGVLCLGHGTAAAVTFPALVAQDSQTTATSPEALFASYGLTDPPSLEVALLGGEPSEENAMFDTVGDAPNATAPASADSLEGFATEGDAYSVMASAGGFESSGNGRGWGSSLVVAGVAAGILAAESGRHTAHGFRFGTPGTSQSPGTPSSTPSLGLGDTPGNDHPASVPEPGTLVLFAAGIAISAALRRRTTGLQVPESHLRR
jgi:hypothetical protein